MCSGKHKLRRKLWITIYARKREHQTLVERCNALRNYINHNKEWENMHQKN